MCYHWKCLSFSDNIGSSVHFFLQKCITAVLLGEKLKSVLNDNIDHSSNAVRTSDSSSSISVSDRLCRNIPRSSMKRHFIKRGGTLVLN